MSTKAAKDYNELVEEYTRLRVEALYDSSIDDSYRLELLDMIGALSGKILAWNAKYINSAHYVIPDPENEFTKH